MKATYTKDNAHYYKTISEEKSICISIGINARIEIIPTVLCLNDNVVPATQEEFESIYKRESDLLRHAALGTTEESEKQQKRIEKAGVYLVDGDADYSIGSQIALIEAAHKINKRTMLSDIDGVAEWQSVAGELNADEFLLLIN